MKKQKLDAHLKDLFADVRLDTGELETLRQRIEIERDSVATVSGEVTDASVRSALGLGRMLRGTGLAGLRVLLATALVLLGLGTAMEIGLFPGGSWRRFLPEDTRGGVPGMLTVLEPYHLDSQEERFRCRRLDWLPSGPTEYLPFVPDETPAEELLGEGLVFEMARDVEFPLWSGEDLQEWQGAQIRFRYGPRARRLDLFQLTTKENWRQPTLPGELRLGKRIHRGLPDREVWLWTRHQVLHVAMLSRGGAGDEGNLTGWVARLRASTWRPHPTRSWGDAFGSFRGSAPSEFRYTSEGTWRSVLLPYRTVEGRYGLMSSRGEAGPAVFREARRSRGGLAACRDEEGWRFMRDVRPSGPGYPSDRRLEVQRFDEVQDFSKGHAAVRQGDRWFYVTEYGRFEIGGVLSLREASPFRQERARVRTPDGLTFLDDRGRVLVLRELEEARDFSGGHAAVRIRGRWGFLDWWGRLAVPPAYDEVRDFHEGRALVRQGALWGAIDPEGRVVIPLEYPGERPLGDFSEGLACFREGDRSGYLDRGGRIVVPATWSRAFSFHQGVGVVLDESGKAFGLAYDGSRLGPLELGSFPAADPVPDRDPFDPGHLLLRPWEPGGRQLFREPVFVRPGPDSPSWQRAWLQVPGDPGEDILEGWLHPRGEFLGAGAHRYLHPARPRVEVSREP